MLRQLYEKELSELKIELIKMCRATESMIHKSMEALLTKDIELAKFTAASDKVVNEYESLIEKKCLNLLLHQQPVARDFRDISTALKMITDIERIADQAADISEIVVKLAETEYTAKLVHIPQMGKVVELMVHNSVQSFVEGDLSLALTTITRDDEVDELFDTVKSELIDSIKRSSETADEAIWLLMIAKYLERIGDHAVNVCEWVEYSLIGYHKKK